MDISNDILRYDEQAIMRLRSLYKQFGYTQYRMSRFEEYGLYAENKAFLSSGNIITFTDASGKLMALRPDVTLSIVKNTGDDGRLKKLFYNENVYRPEGNEFKEQMQVGLECIGELNVELMAETLMLAKKSLEALGGRARLDISHMGFLSGLLQNTGLDQSQRARLLRRFSSKNVHELRSLCDDYGLSSEFIEKLAALVSLHGSYADTIGTLRSISVNEDTEVSLLELEDIFGILGQLTPPDDINLDFSIVNDLNYYSGIIFQGFIEGIPKKVLSGGRYDELLRKFGKKSGAVGFAVYLGFLEQEYPLFSGLESAAESGPDNMINIALPKGRLGEKALAIFENSGYNCPSIHEESRKLVFENPESGVRYFWVKPADVAVYVERGAADIGVVGKDILLESSPDIYELLDLDIGKCQMCVAAERGFVSSDGNGRTLRVATKFPNVARDHYGRQGRDIDIIKLNGSIELAPLLGLSDVIVDLVETGKTLYENNLVVTETIVDISARLVSNKTSFKFKNTAISVLCERIAEIL